MIINLDDALTALDGTPLKDEVGNPVKVRALLVQGLLTDRTDEKKEAAERMKRFMLATRISSYTRSDLEITVEDAKLIKDAVTVFNTLVMGQLWLLIDPASAQ